jgi:hypothetical protein
MATLPDFDALRGNYPDGDPEKVKSSIGGKVDADWITNTCAIRLSRAFNYSGMHIPAHFEGLSVLSGADGKWYAYRMRELKKWIEATFGEPNIEKVQPAGGHITRQSFAATHGIIAFDIKFDDAFGTGPTTSTSPPTRETILRWRRRWCSGNSLSSKGAPAVNGLRTSDGAGHFEKLEIIVKRCLDIYIIKEKSGGSMARRG